MNALRAIARFAATVVILFTGVHVVVGLCIAFFLLTGRLTPGLPMYVDLETPGWGSLLAQLAVTGSVLALAVWVRHRLRPPAP